MKQKSSLKDRLVGSRYFSFGITLSLFVLLYVVGMMNYRGFMKPQVFCNLLLEKGGLSPQPSQTYRTMCGAPRRQHSGLLGYHPGLLRQDLPAQPKHHPGRVRGDRYAIHRRAPAGPSDSPMWMRTTGFTPR